MRKIDYFLSELKNLNLPLGEYVVVSSGSLAVRNIRECNDLDILVTENLFNRMIMEYPFERSGTMRKISIGNLDLLNFDASPNEPYPVECQILEADIIGGVPFQSIEMCRYFKANSSREKDVRDLLLIDAYRGSVQ